MILFALFFAFLVTNVMLAAQGTAQIISVVLNGVVLVVVYVMIADANEGDK